MRTIKPIRYSRLRANPGLRAYELTKGIVALPLMLLIGGIVLEMTIASTLIVFYILQGSIGARSAAEALVTAQSGISDASLQLARNAGYNTGGTSTIFTVDAQHTAQVFVCNGNSKGVATCSINAACSTVSAGKAEITSLGTVKGKNKCVRAVYNIDSTTGEIKLESSAEVAL